MYAVLVIAVVIGFVIAAVVRKADPVRRAAVLRHVGFGLTASFTFLFGAFVVGETFTDPGGWKAAGLVAAWAVPMAGLAALSWFRPGSAVYVFTVLAAAVIGGSIWFAANPAAWRSFEGRHGPIRAVIIMVLVAAIAMLGLKRTAAAGVLLLAIGIVPVTVSSLGSLLGFPSLSIVSAPAVITGVLYLTAAHGTGRGNQPGRVSGGAAARPKAA